VRSGPGKNEQEPKKKKYNGQQQKEMDCHEPHPAPNEKTQPIQWTERPTGALVGANSLWPIGITLLLVWEFLFWGKIRGNAKNKGE
jgi:hypothetical protein